jgi:hypothetical protein
LEAVFSWACTSMPMTVSYSVRVPTAMPPILAAGGNGHDDRAGACRRSPLVPHVLHDRS